MKTILKTITIIGVILIAVLVIAGTAIYLSGPPLPDGIDETIDAVLRSELPVIIRGQTGTVNSGHTPVWYESIGAQPPAKGAVLLFMGIANDALGWPQGFIDLLAGSGYQVIRYDYRGTGMSDWMPDWEKAPYALSDLALDAKQILDDLNVAKAHLVGVSMGGMVAQEFAIRFPQRTLTLTAIMSSGDIVDAEIKGVSKKTMFDLMTVGLKYGLLPTERNIIKMHVAARIILRGDADYKIDVKGTAEQVLYNLRSRKGYNPKVTAQHQEAVRRSGSRYQQLEKLAVPCLVIHGQKDPFVPIEHSQKLASVLPDCQTKWFANMGHDIPPGLYEALTAALTQNFERNPK